MKSEWFRIYNPMAGHTVGRLRNADRPMYSGNVEYAPSAGYMDGDEGRQAMDELAKTLNNKEIVCFEWVPQMVAFRVYRRDDFANTLAYADSRKEIYDKAEEMNWEIVDMDINRRV